jgi:hypothetical protein
MALHIEIKRHPFRATVHEWEDIAGHLEALELSFHVDRDTGVKRGLVVYGAPSARPVVTLAWRWLEVTTGVLVIEDPMNISSNLVLVDDDGHELPVQSRILHLNNVLFCLPWQSPVLAGAKIRRRRSGNWLRAERFDLSMPGADA